jgi:peptidoglycan/LPS O-acetylase OafA/YrhL
MNGAGSPPNRLSALDGLRGICILAVMFGHLSGTGGFPVTARTGSVLAFGSLALLVFFVLSGYLITGIILRERERTGSVRLGRFFARRTLRMAPPYLAAVAGLAALTATGWYTLNAGDVLHAITYTSNYHEDRAWPIAHTWSASAQEQFYVLWPLVLVFAGSRRAATIAALTLLAVPVIRVGEWEFLRWEIGHRFETIADAMAAGCLLACIRPRLHQSPVYMRMLRSRWFPIVPLVAIPANMVADYPLLHYGAAMSLVIVCVTLSIDWVLTFTDGRVARLLEVPLLRGIGLISYSLYLWQQPFLNRHSSAAVSQFPLNLVLAFGAGVVSFYLVERPSMSLRDRFDARRRAEAGARRQRAFPDRPAPAPMGALE